MDAAAHSLPTYSFGLKRSEHRVVYFKSKREKPALARAILSVHGRYDHFLVPLRTVGSLAHVWTKGRVSGIEYPKKSGPRTWYVSRFKLMQKIWQGFGLPKISNKHISRLSIATRTNTIREFRCSGVCHCAAGTRFTHPGSSTTE